LKFFFLTIQTSEVRKAASAPKGLSHPEILCSSKINVNCGKIVAKLWLFSEIARNISDLPAIR